MDKTRKRHICGFSVGDAVRSTHDDAPRRERWSGVVKNVGRHKGRCFVEVSWYAPQGTFIYQSTRFPDSLERMP